MKCGEIHYKMPAAMAAEYLRRKKKAGDRSNNNEYLCKIVNENYGLLHNCTKVIIV